MNTIGQFCLVHPCQLCNYEMVKHNKYDLTVCVYVNEMKMYKFDELLEWLVYSSKWEAVLIDNIHYYGC